MEGQRRGSWYILKNKKKTRSNGKTSPSFPFYGSLWSTYIQTALIFLVKISKTFIMEMGQFLIWWLSYLEFSVCGFNEQRMWALGDVWTDPIQPAQRQTMGFYKHGESYVLIQGIPEVTYFILMTLLWSSVWCHPPEGKHGIKVLIPPGLIIFFFICIKVLGYGKTSFFSRTHCMFRFQSIMVNIGLRGHGLLEGNELTICNCFLHYFFP